MYSESPRHLSQMDLFQYFIRLKNQMKSTYFSDNEFKYNWRSLSNTNYTDEELSLILSSIAHNADEPLLKYVNANLGIWVRSASNRISNFDEENLARSLYALAILSATTHSDASDIAKNIFAEIETRKITANKHITQIKFASLLYDWEWDYEIGTQKDEESRFEQEIRKIFQQAADNKADQLEELKPIVAKVDIPVTIGGSEIYLEADGPYHLTFRCNPDDPKNPLITGYNGSTILKTTLMVKLASQALILRLPFTVGNYLLQELNTNEAVDLANKILNATSEQTHGAYYVDFDEEDNIGIYPMPIAA